MKMEINLKPYFKIRDAWGFAPQESCMVNASEGKNKIGGKYMKNLGTMRHQKKMLVQIGFVALAILILSSIGESATPTFTSSKNVLEIDGNINGTGGPMNMSDFKIGGNFDAGIISWTQIPQGQFNSLANNDTAILFQVNTSELDTNQRTMLVNFAIGGGKLLIWDADAGATPQSPNDYSWLPAGLDFNTSVPGQLGKSGGMLKVTEEDDLASGISTNSKFINTSLLLNLSDAVGDANIVATNGTSWCENMFGQNAATPPQSGPAHMYSKLGGAAGSGLVIYSALDWNFANSFLGVFPNQSGGQLKKMVQFELEVNNSSNLPCKNKVLPHNGSISGMKFNDSNGNGIKDKDETGLNNWTITLKDETGSVDKTLTNNSGSYTFSNLTDGTYIVGEELKSGWFQTVPAVSLNGTATYSVEIKNGNSITDKDFGNSKTNPIPVSPIVLIGFVVVAGIIILRIKR